ncbi:MAG: DUF1338 domain-containing protein [Hyphomicrobiales bacterium]
MKADNIFEKLWSQYTEKNPSVQKIHDLFINEGEEVINDHIAFRTFNLPGVDIDTLAKPFLETGYTYINSYDFETKKLNAKHFEHSKDPNAPRVFISELRVEEFSPFLQETVRSLVNSIPKEKIESNELIYSGRLWEKPSFDIYEKLRKESEYAAWLYVFGFCANHFTVSINHLCQLDSIEKVNEFLKKNNFILNDSGGEIKGTPKDLLEQSSIRAEHISVEFKEGVHNIPGCYYEFARRYKDERGIIYSGFIAKSADKIFESTDQHNKE